MSNAEKIFHKFILISAAIAFVLFVIPELVKF